MVGLTAVAAGECKKSYWLRDALPASVQDLRQSCCHAKEAGRDKPMLKCSRRRKNLSFESTFRIDTILSVKVGVFSAKHGDAGKPGRPKASNDQKLAYPQW
jgi:hypothetical protein